MCCRRAASRSALASVGCRRRLRSLEALHSRNELKGAGRRAGWLGNGRYPVAANPRIPLDTPQLYGDALADVRAEEERAGRDPGQIVGAILAIYCRIGIEQQGREGGRLALTGSVQAIVDDIGHRAAVMERIFKALLSLSSNSPPK